jgi:carbon monoxide dehydrogenase subunit G
MIEKRNPSFRHRVERSNRRVNANPDTRADRALKVRKRAFLAMQQSSIPDKQAQGDNPMAMTMTGEVQLPASREEVWAKLNDPEVLKACIPGCEQLDKNSDSEFQAVATIKVGPVKARWKGKVRLSDLDPPNSYRISGEGEGGVAGFAKGGAKVTLTDDAGGTRLSYDVEAQIGGKLAQLGQRLINSAAKKTADDFFERFAGAVASKAP